MNLSRVLTLIFVGLPFAIFALPSFLFLFEARDRHGFLWAALFAGLAVLVAGIGWLILEGLKNLFQPQKTTENSYGRLGNLSTSAQISDFSQPFPSQNRLISAGKITFFGILALLALWFSVSEGSWVAALPVILAFLAIAGYSWIVEGADRLVSRFRYRRDPSAPSFDPNMTPKEFEDFCADVLDHGGWRASVTKASGDQGVDVVATKKTTKVVFQCKLYSSPVGNKAVQEAIAGKAFLKAQAAAVVSNMHYTPAAQELASATGVRLMHYRDLYHLNPSFFR